MKNWDKMYMAIAHRVAEESKCPRKKVGCCILLESGLLATGLNGFPEGQEEQWNDGEESNPLVTHAELNALGKLLEEGVSAKGSTVYLTLAPCLECSKLLVRAKVSRVVYFEQYRCTEGIEYLRKYGVKVENLGEQALIDYAKQLCEEAKERDSHEVRVFNDLVNKRIEVRYRGCAGYLKWNNKTQRYELLWPNGAYTNYFWGHCEKEVTTQWTEAVDEFLEEL